MVPLFYVALHHQTDRTAVTWRYANSLVLKIIIVMDNHCSNIAVYELESSITSVTLARCESRRRPLPART